MKKPVSTKELPVGLDAFEKALVMRTRLLRASEEEARRHRAALDTQLLEGKRRGYSTRKLGRLTGVTHVAAFYGQQRAEEREKEKENE